MTFIGVGQQFIPLLGKGEGLSAQYTENGIIAFYTVNDPTEMEIQCFDEKTIEVAASNIEKVPVISFQHGANRGWCDCALTCQADLAGKTYSEGTGMLVTLVFADALTATVVGLRAFSISTELSNHIVDVLRVTNPIDLHNPLDINKVTTVQQRYTSQQIADMCPCRYATTEVQGF